MTEFEITMSPSTGVHVSFKVAEDVSADQVAKATTEAANHLRAAFEAWEAYAEQHASERERKFKAMRVEQEDAMLEDWKRQKAARAGAAEKLRSV